MGSPTEIPVASLVEGFSRIPRDPCESVGSCSKKRGTSPGTLRYPARSYRVHRKHSMSSAAATGSVGTHSTPTGTSGIAWEPPRDPTKTTCNIVEHPGKPLFGFKSTIHFVVLWRDCPSKRSVDARDSKSRISRFARVVRHLPAPRFGHHIHHPVAKHERR